MASAIVAPTHSSVNEQKPEVLTYRDNSVRFNFKMGGGYRVLRGSFKITSLSISPGEDPEHKNYVGQVRNFTANDPQLWFVVGRTGSFEVAQFWKNNIKWYQSTFNHDPDALNFAFIGDLTLSITGGPIKASSVTFTFKDIGLAQGHSGATNNWWFGGVPCRHIENTDSVNTSGFSEKNYPWTFRFRRGGNGNDVNVVELEIIEPKGYDTWSVRSNYIGESTQDVWQSAFRRKQLNRPENSSLYYAPPYVSYLTKDQSANLQLFVENNTLKYRRSIASPKGPYSVTELFDTSLGDQKHDNNGAAIFVIGVDGSIYASLQLKPCMFAHSSILAGSQVAGAGVLIVNSGKILRATNGSGHYKPEPKADELQLREALLRLGYSQDFQFDSVNFEDELQFENFEFSVQHSCDE